MTVSSSVADDYVSAYQPPIIQGHQIDKRDPLHKLFYKRIKENRDLKVIITARNSATGVGKTTLAGWLALSWNPIFTGEMWSADTHATLEIPEYFRQYRELNPGSVLILDEAEQLDARRSMATKNVQFSHDWMMLRTRQIVSILTLPSPGALDSRLEELADVWINVTSRGKAMCHGIQVLDYGSRNRQTPRTHEITFPDISDHPGLVELERLKNQKIDDHNKQEKTQSPKEAKRSEKIRIAQRMRENGETTISIAEAIDMSQSWVSQNTSKPSDDND